MARWSGWLSIRFGEYASRAVEHRGSASLLGVTHKQRGLHAVCGLQRGQDTTDVSFDRALPHTEFLRNLCVGISASEEVEDVPFAGRQRLDALAGICCRLRIGPGVAVDKSSGGVGVQDGRSRSHGVDRAHYFAGSSVLSRNPALVWELSREVLPNPAPSDPQVNA